MVTDQFITAYGILVEYMGEGKNITIPEVVRKIGRHTFMRRKNIETVTIPNSVIWIYYGAFAGCTNLKSVTIPDSVVTIGPHAFDYCINLESITIPAGVKRMSENTFKLCDKLTIHAPAGSYAEHFAKAMNISVVTV